MSTSYSMWPVILVPYNLPPWKCMKETFFMMPLLIPGPLAPGKDIDVYMQPLVDELKDLWDNGVQTYDAFSGQNFQMHAAILWTINDFPAYGNLSGWSTKGYMACPVCNQHTCSRKLRSKICFLGHRRYLPLDHIWRKSKKFDGKAEYQVTPKELSGDDVLQQLRKVKDVTPGKHPSNRKRKRTSEELNWTKRSILFQLPYWRKLKLRHNLDVMHIEKNICENILGTLLNIDGKTKDTVKARLDLEDMNIRKELHLMKRHDGSYIMPPACYTLSKEEKQQFCEFLKSVKFPDGYASNISRCVNVSDGRIIGLKSHDCHVFLQRLLPVAVRGFLCKEVATALAELGDFFQLLCCKTLTFEEIKKMEKDIALILCKLEMIFPPAFFDVMVHLAIHLPSEAMLGGPVQFRWMFPIERFLGSLKKYVRNRARPEGSIAEAYVVSESLTFCSMYLNGIETRFNREERNNDFSEDGRLSIFSQKLRPIGAAKYVDLSRKELEMAHWYVLNNCEEIEPYFEEHKEKLKQECPLGVEQRHREKFSVWFRQRMTHLYVREVPGITEALYSLACGPDICVKKYSGCIVNGVRFHTVERDSHRKSQNSGISVEGYHKDNVIKFYGVLTDIIELDYVKDKHVVLFKCQWFNLGDKKSGMQIEGNISSVNVNGLWYENDPFVLACQAKQVFYLDDTRLGKNWRVVQQFQHRHIFDVPEVQNEVIDADELPIVHDEVYQGNESLDSAYTVNVEYHELASLHRDDVNPNVVEANIVHSSTQVEQGDNGEDESEEEDETLEEYYSDEEEIENISDDSDIES